MEIMGQPAAVSAPRQATPPQPNSQRTEISSDFETFLRMLTVQMQNQNPLEPIEASDFAVQLATFSGVEQQVRTNDLLSQMMSQMGLNELSGWIDRDVLTASSQHVSDAPLQLVIPANAAADYAELVFRTDSGVEAARHTIAGDATEISFARPDYASSHLPDGLYSIDVEHFSAGTSLGLEPVLGYSKVTEARIDGGRIKLVLEHGQAVDSTEIVGTRR